MKNKQETKIHNITLYCKDIEIRFIIKNMACLS